MCKKDVGMCKRIRGCVKLCMRVGMCKNKCGNVKKDKGTCKGMRGCEQECGDV